MEGAFPPPPVKGSERLVPITTWAEMFRETQITGVEFDEFWCDRVEAGVAYFFHWLGEPQFTVLVVFDDQGPSLIECRKFCDVLACENESEPIIAEVMQLFSDAGFRRSEVEQ